MVIFFLHHWLPFEVGVMTRPREIYHKGGSEAWLWQNRNKNISPFSWSFSVDFCIVLEKVCVSVHVSSVNRGEKFVVRKNKIRSSRINIMIIFFYHVHKFLQDSKVLTDNLVQFSYEKLQLKKLTDQQFVLVWDSNLQSVLSLPSHWAESYLRVTSVGMTGIKHHQKMRFLLRKKSQALECRALKTLRKVVPILKF